MKNTLAVVNINFLTNKLSAIITIVLVLAVMTSDYIVTSITGNASSQISLGNYFYLYILMIPFFIALSNYKKTMNLNASKRSYYAGSILTYGIAALLVSLCNTLFLVFLNQWIPSYLPMSNLMELTGWLNNGVFIAFLQQAAFLFLTGVALHVLLFVQTYWVGWVADLIIIAIISVFTPIEPLRNVLAGFFKLIMFNSNFLLHIIVCLALTAILCALGLIPLKKRTV